MSLTNLGSVCRSHFNVEVVVENSVDVRDICPVEQQHLFVSVWEEFVEPSLALIKPRGGSFVFNVLDTLDGVVRLKYWLHTRDTDVGDGGHLVELTGCAVLVHSLRLAQVVEVFWVEWENSALLLPLNKILK